MIVAGLDEAALGPSLGPFCACLTRFEVPEGNSDTDLYSCLSEAVAPAGPDSNGRVPVGDSKRLHSPASGTRLLESGMFTFLRAAGHPRPRTFMELLSLFAAEDAAAVGAVPWFRAADELRLPLEPESRTAAAEVLQRTMEQAGVSMRVPRLRVIPAGDFNRRIVSRGGKSGAVRGLLEPMMESVLIPDDPAVLTVDRQGGRRYYGEWLAELRPGERLQAFEEGPARSTYRTGPHLVTFLVKADTLRLEVALASMAAKYTRELAMILFNRWWADRVPGIRPTAGYPQDARRFIADLEAAGVLPEDRDSLIRRL